MIKETFKQAVQNVLSNKVRTFLTICLLYTSGDVWRVNKYHSPELG